MARKAWVTDKKNGLLAGKFFKFVFGSDIAFVLTTSFLRRNSSSACFSKFLSLPCIGCLFKVSRSDLFKWIRLFIKNGCPWIRSSIRAHKTLSEEEQLFGLFQYILLFALYQYSSLESDLQLCSSCWINETHESTNWPEFGQDKFLMIAKEATYSLQSQQAIDSRQTTRGMNFSSLLCPFLTWLVKKLLVAWAFLAFLPYSISTHWFQHTVWIRAWLFIEGKNNDLTKWVQALFCLRELAESSSPRSQPTTAKSHFFKSFWCFESLYGPLSAVKRKQFVKLDEMSKSQRTLRNPKKGHWVALSERQKHITHICVPILQCKTRIILEHWVSQILELGGLHPGWWGLQTTECFASIPASKQHLQQTCKEFKLTCTVFFRDLRADKTFTTRWSGSRIQVRVHVCHLAIKPEGYSRRQSKVLAEKINGQALGVAVQHSFGKSDGQAYWYFCWCCSSKIASNLVTLT